MSTVRTFVRFSIAALFVNALAVACTVESSDDDEDCDPGTTKSCECSDGSEAIRQCNASGTGYGVCECEGNGAGGSGGSSNGGTTQGGGEGPGGETSIGGSGQSTGGAGGDGGASGSGTSGGVANEAGAAGAAGSGGEAGAGNVTPAVCLDPVDSCEDCYFSCCDEWVACTDDATCLDQFFDVLACTDAIKVDRDVKVEDLAACSDQVGTAGGGWSNGLTPETIAMVNCLGGDPSTDTWSGEAVWGADSCNIGCFKK